jgi:hypothetical protein
VKQIKIVCSGADLMSIEEMIHFQHDLKNLSEENYQKIKLSITDLGFSEPISIWQNEGKNYILGGHQRHTALKKMRDEGYEIPLIPVSLVEADNIKQAKKKVLALTSQFGTMTQDGLINFCKLNEFKVEDVMKEFVFPDIPKIVTPPISQPTKDTPSNKDVEYFLEIECEDKDEQTINHELLLAQGYKIKSVTIDNKKNKAK